MLFLNQDVKLDCTIDNGRYFLVIDLSRTNRLFLCSSILRMIFISQSLKRGSFESLCWFVPLVILQICGVKFFNISYAIGMKLHEVLVCKTQFSSIYILVVTYPSTLFALELYVKAGNYLSVCHSIVQSLSFMKVINSTRCTTTQVRYILL